MLVSPKRYGSEAVTIVTWADGTDAEIANMVAAADNGDIDLTDYWSVGQERVVSLAAMEASGSNDYGSWSVGESHAAQDVTLVIMNEGYSVTGVDNSHVHFVVGLKHCLNETGNIGFNNRNWKGSKRRGWCNSIFYVSFPETLKPIFKMFNTKTASTGDNNTSIDITEDRFTLFAEKEIFGSKTWCADTEAAQLNQITWYETSSNRIKQVSGSNYDWWERSSAYYSTGIFCLVYNGDARNGYEDYSRGLAPFGCI